MFKKSTHDLKFHFMRSCLQSGLLNKIRTKSVLICPKQSRSGPKSGNPDQSGFTAFVYFRYIYGIHQAYLTLLVPIWGIAQAYLMQCSCNAQVYLRLISEIYQGHLRHILCISQEYVIISKDHLREISFISHSYLKHISGISKEYIRNVSGIR